MLVNYQFYLIFPNIAFIISLSIGCIVLSLSDFTVAGFPSFFYSFEK
ncbi:MAG: hypothetical protein IKW77_01410 [Salinivirgaceae bacterium]|nr:hypothetical protein [Salinivirgaceae bacterium]